MKTTAADFAAQDQSGLEPGTPPASGLSLGAILRASVLGLALTGMAVTGMAAFSPAQAQSSQDGSFNLKNMSGRTIERFYASVKEARDWGENRLTAAGLANGANLAIRMPPEGSCRTDIRMVYADGLTEEKRDINTCLDRDLVVGTPPRTGTLEVGKNGQRMVGGGDPSFTLVNNGSRPIRELFASLASDDDWGDDRLGRNTIDAGERQQIRLPTGPCNYDLRIVWGNGRTEERRDVNLCETRELSFR